MTPSDTGRDPARLDPDPMPVRDGSGTASDAIPDVWHPCAWCCLPFLPDTTYIRSGDEFYHAGCWYYFSRTCRRSGTRRTRATLTANREAIRVALYRQWLRGKAGRIVESLVRARLAESGSD